MIYKNIEIHNAACLLQGEIPGSIRWLRVPSAVYETMESDNGKRQCCGSTGVELRFVMKSDTVTLRMRVNTGKGVFHVYRGSVQGGWEDHESNKTVGTEAEDFIIKRSENLPVLERIKKDFDQPFSPEVIRVIFDRGRYELIDIIGEVEPPQAEQLPEKTLFAYGSSITHGSNSIDISHSWVSILAHNLGMDARNLGMAGSCLMESAIVDYVAGEGEKDKWNIALLELGINALDWEENKIKERVENTLRQVAGRNPNKPVFVISPFYCIDDYMREGKADKWRGLISDVVQTGKYKNVTYISGLELLGDMSLISADEVHPNIYGVTQIAERLTDLIKRGLYESK